MKVTGRGVLLRLTRGSDAGASERGAVAVVVGLLLVSFAGLGAFTLDLGMAYASNTALQTASDAAALGAANVFADKPGSCATILANPTWTAQAASTAAALRAQNRPASVEASYSATCTAKGAIQITYRSGASTPSLLGGAVGHAGPYDSQKVAVALVAAPSQAVGVRPYAICGSQLPSPGTTTVFKMNLPASGNSMCPGASSSGNWWSIDCPEAPSNSSQYLGTATQYGCTSPISVVPSQAPRTGTALRTYLQGSCAATSPSCLGANTGNLGGTPILQAWNYLVSSQEPILLPVFCGAPPCDQAAVVNAGGNNAVYPVMALAGVVVCGYHFGGQDSAALNMTGDCGGITNNPTGLTPTTGDNQDNYLLLKLAKATSLTSGDDTDCALGSTCDLQQRIVALVQ